MSLEPSTDKEKHKNRRKRNLIAKELLDRKGPFGMKVAPNEYKRTKINLKDIDYDSDDY